MSSPAEPVGLAGEVARRSVAALARAGVDAEVVSVAPLLGGTSSLTFDVRMALRGVDAGRRAVVKIAPAGVPATLNRDVLRQVRALRVLMTNSNVPVPAVLATDVTPPPLFVMEYVDGDSYEPYFNLDVGRVPDSDVTARAFRLVDLLVQLQRVPSVLFEEPVTSLESEIAKWERCFIKAGGSSSTSARTCAQRLRDALPPQADSVLVHGDFRLGNCLAQGTDIAAVIDWEVWTVGDPRVDLGWLLNMADPSCPRQAPETYGMPSAEELLEDYCRRTGACQSSVGWFMALGRYRRAAMTALIVDRARRNRGGDADLVSLDADIAPLLSSVLERLDGDPR